MRMFFCPNAYNKCFHTSYLDNESDGSSSKVIRISDEISNVGGTTLDFGKNDICSWRIIVDS
jgi:hypothetical protein